MSSWGWGVSRAASEKYIGTKKPMKLVRKPAQLRSEVVYPHVEEDQLQSQPHGTYEGQDSQSTAHNVRLRHREVLVEAVQARVLRELPSASNAHTSVSSCNGKRQGATVSAPRIHTGCATCLTHELVKLLLDHLSLRRHVDNSKMENVAFVSAGTTLQVWPALLTAVLTRPNRSRHAAVVSC